MVGLLIYPVLIGLGASLIEALIVGLYFGDRRLGLLALMGGLLGSLLPMLLYLAVPSIWFRLGLALAGGKDVFGSSILGAGICLTIAVFLGSLLGALIAVKL